MRKFSLNGRLVQYRQMSAGIESYIWRTMGDKRVRPAHRARAGVVYKWSNPPEGGHPGQAVRCRCVAQPLIDESSFKLVPQKNSYTEQNQNDIIKSRLQYLKENKKLTTKNIKKVVPRNAKEKGSGRTQALKKSYKLSSKSMPKYVKSSHNKVPRLPEGEYNLTVRRQVQNRHLQKNSYTTAEESAKINTGNKPRWAERDKLKFYRRKNIQNFENWQIQKEFTYRE